jgi:hypothetical protein
MTTRARRAHAAQEHAGARDSIVQVSTIEAGQKLREHLEKKYLSGLLTGYDFAIQAHFTTLAGGVGLEDLAVRPEQAEKHGAEHVEFIVAQKYPRPNLKTIEIAANSKHGCVREKINCPIRLPSQIFSESYSDAEHVEPPGCDPSVVSLFPNHPVVRRGLDAGLHWSRILPLVLYTDGVKYSTRDSFVGFYVTNYRNMEMYLCALFRKEDACKCGCRGWCTMFPILLELALDLRDAVVLGFLLATIMTKGDWPAYCEISGVRQWLGSEGKHFFVYFYVHACHPI